MSTETQSHAPEVHPPAAPSAVPSPAEIRSRIKQIIANVAGLDAAKIPDQAALRDDLSLDSLSLLEISVDVDFTFKLNLPDERYKEVQSLDDMVDLVARRLAEPARAEAV
jgi:acyl carrier protein